MGGSNHHSNFITLSIPDHAEAHRLLYKKYNKRADFMAWQMLLGKTEFKEQLRKEVAKEAFIKFISNPITKFLWRCNISDGLRRYTFTESHRRSLSIAQRKLYSEGRGGFQLHYSNYKFTSDDNKKAAVARKSSDIWKEAVTSEECQTKKRMNSKLRTEVTISGTTYNSIREASKLSGIQYNRLLDIINGKINDDRVTFIKIVN